MILKIIKKILCLIFGLKPKSDSSKQIRNDQKLADAIRNKDGRKVAEEWKKRKQQ